MNPTPIKLQIVLINDDPSEVTQIEAHLQNDMRVPWHLETFSNVEIARSHVTEADIIILKPEVVGLTRNEVFADLQDMVYETPIIVLTNALNMGRSKGADTGFSTYLMEQGAADTVIRGQFARMVDAIEFAMIRQRIATAARRDADHALAQNEKQNRNAASNVSTKHGSEVERHRQIVRMFLGDYSTERTN